jgi:hypothetical protein
MGSKLELAIAKVSKEKKRFAEGMMITRRVICDYFEG